MNPKGIDNCTKEVVLGDFLWLPRKDLMPATVDISKFWWYDLLEANDAIEKWKLYSIFEYTELHFMIEKDQKV